MKTEERPLVNMGLVKAHLVASMVFFATLLLAGLSFSLTLNRLNPFPGVELLSAGRLRMVHTNMAAYGFIANAFLAGVLYAIPRLTKRPIWSDKLGWLIFWAWQAIVVLTLGGILAGFAQAIEWGETPIFVDPLVVVGWVLVVANLIVPIIKTQERGLYVSSWYFLAAFIWTALTYVMGNYFPQFFTAGTAGAAITGLFIHDLVGLLVTPIGWGLMYFFVPLILKKPIWSHALSLIGFWGIAFFYPMQGVHHFLLSPIPMYAQYAAIVATIAIEITVATVIVNFFGTLFGRTDMVRSNLSIRWFYTGMIMYFITCLQCSFQVTLTFQQIIHFTDWVVGHAHLVMFGVFGFWIMGMIHYLWPRVVQREWHSARLNTWHYWLTTIGLSLMFVDLLAAGLVQGYTWRSLAPWADSINFSIPFWMGRTLFGLMIIVGQVILFYNMWATARKPSPAQASEPVLATEPA
ncbi:MAG: cytochrome oxidase [Calditrichaeota bacterium]|nr:MAG: cytochrome oxidase [Calditrichota bacterium]